MHSALVNTCKRNLPVPAVLFSSLPNKYSLLPFFVPEMRTSLTDAGLSVGIRILLVIEEPCPVSIMALIFYTTHSQVKATALL